jgi:hypothetical protein
MDGTIDEVGSTLKIIEKCIVVIVLTLAAVLFLPEEAAKSTGIAKVRNEYCGYLWIGFIFSVLYLVFSTGKWVVNKRIAASQELKIIAIKSEQARLDKKADSDLSEQKKIKLKQEQTQHFQLLFSALTEDELSWVRYCLIKQQMTVNTSLDNSTARSLELKQLVVHGAGRSNNLPYSFQAEVWEFLTTNRAQFLPETDLSSLEIKRELTTFEESLHPVYG